MILSAYAALTAMSGPFLSWYLRRRQQRGKEDGNRLGERSGYATIPRPSGRVVWLHGASVGEALSLLPIIERLSLCPGWTVLLTTGTVTSARLMAERLPVSVLHQYVPVDHPAFVRRFLRHWSPDLAIWCESDFWPNLMQQTAQTQCPTVLVQGRMSPRSFRRWRRMPRTIRRLLGHFALILAQTPDDAGRLRALGGRDVRYVGNLKLVAKPLPVDELDLQHHHHAMAGRPCWLAASTHDGEEAMAGRLHQQLCPQHPNLLTIIAPRHPDRSAAIAQHLTQMGLVVACRSLGQPITAETDLYLADTMGELGLFYRLSPIVFVGKSLLARGGQNPFEPALLGAAVVFGPFMDNFPLLAPQMVAAQAAFQVADEAELQQTLHRWLSDSDSLARQRQQSLSWAGDQAGVLDAVDAALTPFLTLGDCHARS